MEEHPGRTAELLADLLEVCRAGLDGLDVPSDLSLRCLGGFVGFAHGQASAVLDLASARNEPAGNVVLRALIESWITCRYILNDDSEVRAAAYVLQPMRDSLKFLRRLRTISDSHPENAPLVLKGAGVTSIEGLDAKISETEAALTKNEHVRALPSLEQRAQAVEAEWMYASVYAFLFSDEVHAGARATLKFTVSHPSLSDEARATHAEKMLVTTFTLFLDFLEQASEHLGQPTESELAPFQDYRRELEGLTS